MRPHLQGAPWTHVTSAIKLHGSPPAWAGLQDTRFSEVSQRVHKPLYKRIAGGTAHPRSAVGHQRPEWLWRTDNKANGSHEGSYCKTEGHKTAIVTCLDPTHVLSRLVIAKTSAHGLHSQYRGRTSCRLL